MDLDICDRATLRQISDDAIMKRATQPSLDIRNWCKLIKRDVLSAAHDGSDGIKIELGEPGAMRRMKEEWLSAFVRHARLSSSIEGSLFVLSWTR